MPRPKSDFCKRGHPRNSDRWRKCRTCERERSRLNRENDFDKIIARRERAERREAKRLEAENLDTKRPAERLHYGAVMQLADTDLPLDARPRDLLETLAAGLGLEDLGFTLKTEIDE